MYIPMYKKSLKNRRRTKRTEEGGGEGDTHITMVTHNNIDKYIRENV